MRTILTLLLLPMVLNGQMPIQHQYNDHPVAFSLDVEMEYLIKEHVELVENTEGTIEVVLTVEVIYEENVNFQFPSDFAAYSKTAYSIPQHLVTFSLGGFHHNNTSQTNPEQVLDDLFVFNDQTYPEEDTLFNWLKPVRHYVSKVYETNYLPIGFGPSISL